MRCRRGDGFTLVEVLVALGIFVVVVSGIVGLMLVATASHKRAVDNTRAALVADTVLAELESAIHSGHTLAPIAKRAHPDHPGVSYAVEIHWIDGASAQVGIIVSWQREGQQREQRFATVLLARQR
jgi:type II secretory pathway pseudopilin PulG